MPEVEWLAATALPGRAAAAAEILAELAAGRGVVIAGAAGIGKTALAKACVAAAPTARWCRGTESAASLPFGAVASLVPPSAEHRELSEVVHAVVDMLAAAKVSVVVIDDAHLLDDASATLVLHLVQVSACPVVVTIRSDATMPDAIAVLHRDEVLRRVELTPLTLEEVTDVAASVLGGPVERATAQRLFTVSGGNPMYLRELLASAQAAGATQHVSGLWRWQGDLRASRSLVEIVEERMGRLSRTERDVILLIALTEPIRVSWLRQVVDGSDLLALDRAELVGIDGEPQSATARVVHPLYGEVLRSRTTALEREVLLQRLAGAVIGNEAITSDPDRARVARWALATGAPVPPELALVAARDALGTSDAAGAVELGEVALRGPHPICFEAALVLTTALQALQRHGEADAILASSEAQPRDDEEIVRHARARALVLQYGLDDFEAADAVLREAEGRVGDAGRAILTGQRAMNLGFVGRLREAGELALPLLDHPDDMVRLRAISPAGTWMLTRARTDELLEVTNRELPTALALLDREPEALFWVGSLHLMALLVGGRLDELDQTLDLVAGIAMTTTSSSAGYLALLRGRALLVRGRPMSAARELREAVSGFGQSDNAGRLAWTWALVAEASALVGDSHAAAEAAEHAQRNNRPLSSLYSSDLDRALAWVTVAEGRVRDARAKMLELAAALRDENPLMSAFALHDAVRLGARGDALAELVTHAGSVEALWPRLFARRAQGILDGDGTALESVAQDFADTGAMLFAAESALEAAAEFERGGRPDAARRNRQRAETLRAACEAARTPALSSAASASVLTARELEVASLAAQGMASKDIAARLGCSTRTVDNHLQRVYTKLGVSGRLALQREPWLVAPE